MKTGCTDLEIGLQYSALELGQNLENPEKVVYQKNGNSAIEGRVFLRNLMSALRRIGVRRAADISWRRLKVILENLETRN